jgi:hypothetical protein
MPKSGAKQAAQPILENHCSRILPNCGQLLT